MESKTAGGDRTELEFGRPEDVSVGIVGGAGEMGALFRRFFEEAGYTVRISDRDTPLDNRELVKSSSIVLFAVPLHLTVDVIRELVPLVREDQLLLDLTSLKAAPVEAMLQSRASVVGLHPMFGGGVKSFAGQTLAACPVRIEDKAWRELRALFESSGMRVKECTPEQHDRMMSIIQVLFHMTTMMMGRVLRELDVDIFETLEYTSPSYRLEMDILGRIFAQNPSLYAAISQLNPHTPDIVEELKKALGLYEKWFREEDLDSFARDFEESARHLGDFCKEAYEESSIILDLVVKLAERNRRP
jgi:prephenate dehydrogenase